MKNIKICMIIIMLFIIFNNMPIKSLNEAYILATAICVLILSHKIINIKIKNTYNLTKIAFFASIGTISRCFFYLIPHFNPFLPIIILSSINMGKDYGFLIGILSIFISNIFLGHGLWTPWQMVAAGTVGYLSGLTFNNKIRPTPMRLVIFSPICIICGYSLIMNLYSVLLLINTPNQNAILTYLIPSLTTDSICAIFSAIFIIILYNPIINTVRKIYKTVER